MKWEPGVIYLSKGEPPDKYIWLEDLKNPKTLEFVKMHNTRFRKFVGDLPKKLYKRIEPWFRLSNVIMAIPTDSGIFVLYRTWDQYIISRISSEGKEKIISSKEIDENALITQIYPSEDGKKLGFFFTISGSDVGKLRIIETESKEIIDEIEGSVWAVS